MKTIVLPLSLRSLLPSMLCCLLALPVIGFAEYANAVPKVPAVQQQAVSINQADAQTLADTLKGVGLKKAEAIVAWRQQNGKFTKLEQLLEVKGIGEKTLALNKGKIRL